MSDIKATLVVDMKTAMKNREKERLSTIRMTLAAIKQKEIDDQLILSDDDVINIITRMIKQRNDSASQYQNANRLELAEKELAEISILQEYLPKALSEEEVFSIIRSAISQTQADSMKDMGKVMGIVRAQVFARADMGKVSAIIKSELNG